MVHELSLETSPNIKYPPSFCGPEVLNGIAQTIGGDVTPMRVLNLLEQSHQRGLLFHGIKRNADFLTVQQDGIKPLTPEGGDVSFWATGLKLFSNRTDKLTPLATLDTSFFQYANSSDAAGSDFSFMTLAVSSYDILKRFASFPFTPDGDVMIHSEVPREAIEIIRIEGIRTDANSRNRRLLFCALEEIAKRGLKPGTTNLFSSVN